MSVQTLESMVTWVKNNAIENSTLANLSKKFRYSPFYCSSQFKGYTGISIKKYIAQQKLAAAEVLLRTTEERVMMLLCIVVTLPMRL